MDKLAAIIVENGLKSITVMEMEVPCCSSMSAILAQAVKRASVPVNAQRVIVSLDGRVLRTEPFNA